MRVLADRQGMLTRDMTVAGSFQSPGAAVPGVRSLLCFPMATREAVLGAMYIVASARAVFDADLAEAFVQAAVTPTDSGTSFHAAVLETKKRAIIQAFHAAGGNYAEAARLLRIHPNYLHRVIRVLGPKPLLTGKS